MLRTFLTDLIKYVPGRLVPAIIGVISIPILTNLFPPESYGNYSLVLSLVNFLSIAVSWVGMANIRFFPNYEKRNKTTEYSSTVLTITFYSILIAVSIYIVGILIFSKGDNQETSVLLWLSIPYFALLSLFAVIQNFLRVKGKISLFSIASIWRVTASFAIGVFLILALGFQIEGLFIGSILSITIAVFFLFRKAFSNVHFSFKIDLKLLGKFFLYSYPLVISSSLAFLIKFSDRFFLAHFADLSQVGIYAANYAIADKSILIIVSLFLYAAHPLSIKVWENSGEEKSKLFLQKTTAIYIWFTIPALFGITALRNDVAYLLLEDQYIEGIKILPMIALASFLFGLQQRYQTGIHLFMKTKYITFSIILAAIVSAISNIILIPRLGYYGAAISNLIAYSFMTASIIFYSRKFIKWSFPIVTTIKAIIASTFMFLCLQLIHFEKILSNNLLLFLLKLACGMVMYALLMYVFNTYTRKSFSYN